MPLFSKTCSYHGYSVIMYISERLMAVVCTCNQEDNWEWKCRKLNLQPWLTNFHFTQPLHVWKLDWTIEYCSGNWPFSFSTLRTQPSHQKTWKISVKDKLQPCLAPFNSRLILCNDVWAWSLSSISGEKGWETFSRQECGQAPAGTQLSKFT